MLVLTSILESFSNLNQEDNDKIKRILKQRWEFIWQVAHEDLENLTVEELKFPLTVEFFLEIILSKEQALVLKLKRKRYWEKYVENKGTQYWIPKRIQPQIILRKEKELFELASMLNTSVGFVPFINSNKDGENESITYGRYYHSENLILLKEGMYYEQYITFFRHELVHAIQIAFPKRLENYFPPIWEIVRKEKTYKEVKFLKNHLEWDLNKLAQDKTELYKALDKFYLELIERHWLLPGKQELELPAYFFQDNWGLFKPYIEQLKNVVRKE